jgi:hypothetical protein
MVDRLRDSFCRQHALELIFTDEGDTHLSAEMYISMDNTVEEPEWVPSPIFQVFTSYIYLLPLENLNLTAYVIRVAYIHP